MANEPCPLHEQTIHVLDRIETTLARVEERLGAGDVKIAELALHMVHLREGLTDTDHALNGHLETHEQIKMTVLSKVGTVLVSFILGAVAVIAAAWRMYAP